MGNKINGIWLWYRIKGNSIPHVDALWSERFYKESKDKTEEFEDTFLHWVETDVLSLDRMAAETRHDPVLNRITSRINKKKKHMGKLLQSREALQSYTDYFTFMAQRSGAIALCAYGSCIHYWSGTN